MQIEKATIELVKAKMKHHYPSNYALEILQKLRSRNISVTCQQIYNVFNGLGALRSDLIINAAFELLDEARENGCKSQKS